MSYRVYEVVTDEYGKPRSFEKLDDASTFARQICGFSACIIDEETGDLIWIGM